MADAGPLALTRGDCPFVHASRAPTRVGLTFPPWTWTWTITTRNEPRR